MRLSSVLLFSLVCIAGNTFAQSNGDSCGCSNKGATLGVASSERGSILSDSTCSLRLVLKSPSRGDEMSIPSGIVERNFMGTTFNAPFNKISDLLVLSVALQNDAMFPAAFARGAREAVAALKVMEDDPKAGLRWSFVFRASSQPTDDRVTLRATWRNPSATSGFSSTEVRLAASNFTLWCR